MCFVGHQERSVYLFVRVLCATNDRNASLKQYFTYADPLQVNWRLDGCETRRHGPKHTECLCNHLTYFSILVVRHAASALVFYKKDRE